jgi:hypothetical protein
MADNLTTFMCRLSRNLGASTSRNPKGLSRPVMGLLFLKDSFAKSTGKNCRPYYYPSVGVRKLYPTNVSYNPIMLNLTITFTNWRNGLMIKIKFGGKKRKQDRTMKCKRWDFG